MKITEYRFCPQSGVRPPRQGAFFHCLKTQSPLHFLISQNHCHLDATAMLSLPHVLLSCETLLDSFYVTFPLILMCLHKQKFRVPLAAECQGEPWLNNSLSHSYTLHIMQWENCWNNPSSLWKWGPGLLIDVSVPLWWELWIGWKTHRAPANPPTPHTQTRTHTHIHTLAS